MKIIESFTTYPASYQFIVISIIIWDFAWKLLALWRAARRGQTTWFILLAILNTVGILPIIYLLTHSKK